MVYVSDWRGWGGLQRAGVDEVRALVTAGLRVGVAHLEAARFLSGTAFPFTWEVDEVVVLANQLPTDVDGLDHRYRVEDCAHNVARLMGRRPLWVPEGPAVREAIRGGVLSSELADVDLATVIDVDLLSTQRRQFRSDRPVIGRHGGDGRFKWPKSPKQLRAVYPVDGSFDVRFMGGAATATKRLGLRRPPAAWVVFEPGELPIRTFLNSLDFFVSFTDSRVSTTLARPVLEAAASGSVVLLPPRLEATFGDIACYAEPEDAAEFIRRAYHEPKAYRAMSVRGQDAVRRRHHSGTYTGVIASFLRGGGRPEVTIDHG